MAVDVTEEKIGETITEDSHNAVIETVPILCDSEPNLALIDFSDGIWYSDIWTSTCSAIKDRYIRANSRFKKFTSADILACIKFENTDDEDNRRKQKRNRRVRFSTGMSISVDSLVQCNSDHQTESRENGDHLQERQFLEAEFLKVPAHRHLTTGENKICNAFFEDKKTVGYGRSCRNLYTSYNNPFDPRLSFNGLHGELNIATSVPASGDTKSTTTFNGAIALIEDPTEFLNTYLNSYRNYLKSLEPPAHFSNGHESDLLEESESSINIQDTSEVDEEENSLLQKLESVRSLWSSDADEGHLDDICLEGNIKNGFPPPLDVDIEGISEALDSLHLGGQQSPLASTPKIQNMNVKQRGDEKLIVHTTCLSSDGQSTETMIHETILKPPHEIPPVRNGKQEDNGERILRFVGHDIDISYPVGKVHPNADDNTGKTSEECDDDSDGTLTPGEEETNIKVPLEMETPREPILLLRRGQTNAEFESENKINAQRSRDMANYIRESREPNTGTVPNAGQKKQTKLRATTEPFVPTSQKIFENASLASNGVIGDHGATVKQTTAPTENGPIYQTSEMVNKARASEPEDASKNFPGSWNSYQPPNQQRLPPERHFQQPNPHVMNRQPEPNTLPSQQTPSEPPSNYHTAPPPGYPNLPPGDASLPPGNPAPPPGFQQDMQNVRYQYPDRFKQENINSADSNRQQTHQFETSVRAHPPNQYHLSANRGTHIPVYTTTSRNHLPTGSRNSRAKVRNQSRQQSYNNGRQSWIPQANSLQGQPSNTQPVYNAFWLQFQNTGNPNIQHSVHVPPPQMGPASNLGQPGRRSIPRPETSQRYGFQAHIKPQCPHQQDMFQQHVSQQQPRPNYPVPDNPYVRPQNTTDAMNYPASQQNRRSAVSGPSARASGPGSPCFDSQPFDANTNNNNGNDNALMDVEQDCIESNVITLRDDPEEILEMDGHSIDVLENSRSRENYRTKKHGKRLRPIRSCLVQVV